MNEFEALKRLRQETCPATYMPDFDKEECCDVIEKALLELKAIKEAKPNEALECLEIFKVHYEETNNQWYLQIHFNNDELRVIQLPLLPYEANDIDLLLQNKKTLSNKPY